jgi:hypothetical protein
LNRAIAVLALVVLGGGMLTNSAFRRRQIMRRVAERVEGVGRHVDIGVTLRIVTADDAGEELLEGKPRMRVLREIHFGGVVDTMAMPPDVIGPSRSPQVWYVSEDQAAALLHTGDTVTAQLIRGSEGAGKTRLLAMWHYFQWIRHLGERREGGQTAPTGARLEFVRAEMFELFAPNWYRYRASESCFVMCDGTRIQLVSTYRQSTAQGSPVQGYSWSWCGRDELQDQTEIHEDVESRGRAAKYGRYPQLATATNKDDSAWRELRDRLRASGTWLERTLSIFRSPFIHRAFIEAKKSTMSVREFLRRYGDPKTGELPDLIPELAVYFNWLRERNLVPRPQIATDVTRAVLAGYRSYLPTRTGEQSRLVLGVGHDPGVIFNTSEIARLQMFRDVPTWVVVGELQTKQTTQREHARELVKMLRGDFGCNFVDGIDRAAVFCDPHGKGERQTDYQAVYMAMQAEGLDVFNPAPVTPVTPTGRIKRAARIEMANRLLGGSARMPGVPRLVVAQDEQGRVAAPRLVDAFESLRKRPGDDDPEGVQRKDEDDKTHGPAALSYLLWPFEQEAITDHTVKTAIAAARRFS